ncbi:hypothetical protein [Paenibacillus sp. MMS20-IR301]|uniref:hypothetical protein n=1 Tax=Paenibacillus sp. MMS20-IR301 TaxID=2895946 RepID=UPI0028E72481|nr:hypothetical protein [Paenibacillus sp. MMS20-IR301]WNS44817.1 hypothetical protein LOS79_05955 [Paenibacillus sp. MMS20-IR301]
MIRNRYFMLGLGAGLIAGALLLQLMFSARVAPLTKEELIREAARLNLTVTDPADTAAGEATPAPEGGTTDEPAQAAGQTPAPEATAAPSPAPAVPPEAAAEPSAAVTPLKPSAPSQPQNEAADTGTAAPANPEAPAVSVNDAISVRIPTGITLSQTADLLAEAGVIQDKTKFLQAAVSRKANKIIQYGSYSFAKGESIDSIIDKLITVKK